MTHVTHHVGQHQYGHQEVKDGVYVCVCARARDVGVLGMTVICVMRVMNLLHHDTKTGRGYLYEERSWRRVFLKGAAPFFYLCHTMIPKPEGDTMVASLSLTELEGHFYRLRTECAELEQKLAAVVEALMPVWSARREIKAAIVDTHDLDPRGLPVPRSGDARRRAVLTAQLDEINLDPKVVPLTREHRILQQTVNTWKREITKVEGLMARAAKAVKAVK